MSELIDLKHSDKQIKAILVGVNTEYEDEKFDRLMHELKELAKACELKPVFTLTQKLPHAETGTYVGSGKLEEIKNGIEMYDADIVIVNDTLTPMQIRNLEKFFDAEVIDRTGLILQIFASRAKTREARLQVESAQLQYMLPRLAHMRNNLSRQGGGSGRLSNKGSGEKKLELDRRRIEHRISELRKELKSIENERNTQRSKRMYSGIPKVSLVGYTNAGKSTMMNTLLKLYGGKEADEKMVFEKDMLFATLDTTIRSIEPDGHHPFLLADTVGFIDDLPHSLVKAFRSTLEEVKYSDLLLEIIDFSDPDFENHISVTSKTLQEIGAGEIPIIYVFNKSDKVNEDSENINRSSVQIPYVRDDRIYMSAKKEIGISELV
ncbi:MAG: GTPase HflX, partial [Butyrivibrio sp.]|nr:GTPase HflX [Butyrivibrio sp.]